MGSAYEKKRRDQSDAVPGVDCAVCSLCLVWSTSLLTLVNVE
ncbi:hypothetical protein PC128_g27163 [Phytophthora cactorum]|nr:hypothetical protein C6341_g27215 [Phytophthora cactorum]KAG3126919.1 hypothetical protein PC128_g27163 [Phytophthora cactorum]